MVGVDYYYLGVVRRAYTHPHITPMCFSGQPALEAELQAIDAVQVRMKTMYAFCVFPMPMLSC